MVTIKAFTDIPQSKKLIELGIDVNTADMYWWYNGQKHYAETKDHNDFQKSDIPCWSLAALLNIIPQEIFDGEYIINITEGRDNKWIITYDHHKNRNHSYYGLSTGADNLVDACTDIIIKLKERNII